jgi:hypothetical protein
MKKRNVKFDFRRGQSGKRMEHTPYLDDVVPYISAPLPQTGPSSNRDNPPTMAPRVEAVGASFDL